MRAGFQKTTAAVKQLWNAENKLTVQSIQRKNVKCLLAYPLSIIFFLFSFYKVSPHVVFMGLSSIALTAFFFCLAAFLVVCMPERHLQAALRIALLVGGIGLLGTFAAPEGLVKSLSGCLCMVSAGAADASLLFLFCVRLNNVERLAGLALFFMAIYINFGMMGLNAPAWAYDVAFVLVYLCLLLTARSLRYQKADRPKEEAYKAYEKSSYLILVYVLPLFLIAQLMRESLELAGELVMTQYMFAGFSAIGILALLLIVFNCGVWHMWNATLLVMVLSIVFFWMGPEFVSIGSFLCNVMVTLYFYTFIYMFTGIVKRFDNYRFYRKFLMTYFGGMLVVIFMEWLLVSALPGSLLVALTVIVVIFILTVLMLTPLLSQKIFLPDWAQSLHKTNVERATEEAENPFDPYRLTPREKEVAMLLLQGLTMRQISGKLGIAYSTTNSHGKNLYKKLGINSRMELLARFSGRIK